MKKRVKFVNYGAGDEVEPYVESVVVFTMEDAHKVMSWYGSHYSGDEYEVWINDRQVQIDDNGELKPVIVDVSSETIDSDEHEWFWVQSKVCTADRRMIACKKCGRVKTGKNKPCPGNVKVAFRVDMEV